MSTFEATEYNSDDIKKKLKDSWKSKLQKTFNELRNKEDTDCYPKIWKGDGNHWGNAEDYTVIYFLCRMAKNDECHFLAFGSSFELYNEKDIGNTDESGIPNIKLAIFLHSDTGTKTRNYILSQKDISINSSRIDIKYLQREGLGPALMVPDILLSELKPEDGKSEIVYTEVIKKMLNAIFEVDDMPKIKKLLEENKQVILTGAPGTGKTYLAKQIAADMIGTNLEGLENNDQFKFVQFHPSFDYTDFVEGLRPETNKDGSIGFKRRDGIFKKFAANALNALNATLNDAISEFLKDAKSKKRVFPLTRGETHFEVAEYTDSKIFVSVQEDVTQSRLSLETATIKNMIKSGLTFSKILDVTNYLGKDSSHREDSYYYTLYEYILNNLKEREKLLKKYVFVIDEINRGDISKIFGELFYAIDPGYRGKKGKVDTQYQNLIEDENDPFKTGFYVPKNVYIIGTMNDIDRSVESMDFAIRRRFIWYAITPKVTQNIILHDDEYGKAAKDKMNAINKVISETNGLGEAFQLGASYFQAKEDGEKTNDYLNQVWEYRIEPLLKEYLRGLPNDKEAFGMLKKAWDDPKSVPKSQDDGVEGEIQNPKND